MVTWEVVVLDEFEHWYLSLDTLSRARIYDRVALLESLGPALGRPAVDRIASGRHSNMKELRSGSMRVLFIFDPISNAVLLLGGDKRGDWTGWYHEHIPKADDLYDEYLERTRSNQT